jgi:hypothetical protein
VLQTAGQTRTLNISLNIATQAQSVNVAASPALDETTATFGGSVQPVQVSEVPINGRNWSTLETLTPGAINLGTGGQSSIRFAGQGMVFAQKPAKLKAIMADILENAEADELLNSGELPCGHFRPLV